jgi:hypothetical protein
VKITTFSVWGVLPTGVVRPRASPSPARVQGARKLCPEWSSLGRTSPAHQSGPAKPGRSSWGLFLAAFSTVRFHFGGWRFYRCVFWSWRKFRPLQPEVPPRCSFRQTHSAFLIAGFILWPEVPVKLAGSSGQRNFRPTSGQVPKVGVLWLSMSSMVFLEFRNLAGTWPELPVTGSSALVPPQSFLTRLPDEESSWRKFRPSWPVLPVPAGTSGPPGRNFRCYEK